MGVLPYHCLRNQEQKVNSLRKSFVIFSIVVGFISTTILTYYEALPLPYSPVSSLPFPLLAYRRCASLFKQTDFRLPTHSVLVGEVTQVNSIAVSPIHPAKRDDPLHEVSGVKVPRPASPFITHVTHETRRYVGRWRLLYLVAIGEMSKLIFLLIS